VSRTALGNGATLLVLEDHRQPLAAASLQIQVGSGDDPEGRSGLASMALRLIAMRAAVRAKETKSGPRSMLLIPEALTTRDALEIRFAGPASDLTAGLAALAWSLQQPLPGSGPALETVRQSCLASLQRAERDPDTIGIDLFREKVYAGDAYAGRSEGTAAGLTAVTEGDLKEFGTRALRPDRVVLAVVGDVETKALAREVERILGSWSAPSTAAPAPKDAAAPPAPASATSGSQAGEYSRLSSAAQSHVVAGVPAIALLDQDFPGLRQVGGVVTLLTFEELVFARRSAYSVVTFPEGLRRGGSLAFEVIASHGRRDDALFELQRIMRRLATEDLREEDRRDAARMIAGSSAIASQRALPLASTLAYREAAGVGARSWRDEFTPAPLSSERLKALAERYFKPASWISVVVGPPQP
jgi:zinc protease